MCQPTETAETRKPFVFEIREERFERLAERFAKMVGRARKCKLPAPSFAVIHEADERHGEEWVRYLYVTVEGERPQLSGWDFVATVDHTEAGSDGTGNVIKSVPGAGQIPVSYRNAFPVCDHCKTARNRHETFVVRSQSDPTITRQIGRNCLQDFFPGDSPADVATQLAWWTEAVEMLGEGDGEESFGGSGGLARYGLESLLLTTQAAIEAFGWTSRTKARETGVTATVDRVTLCYLPESRLTPDERAEVAEITAHRDPEKHAPIVEAALAWVRAIDPETAEDYLYNLHMVTRGETVRSDRIGLACSLLPAYRRFIDGEREKREAIANPSEFVGAEGVRGLFQECLLKHVSEPYESQYGTTTRLTFAQGANIIVWWASNAEGFDVDSTYDIVATPKKHEVYRNARKGTETRQTVVNRVAIATDKDRKKFLKPAKMAI